MVFDPCSLLKASLEGDDSGTCILSIDKSSKKFEIIVKNQIFTSLEAGFDLDSFLSQKIDHYDFSTELIYKTNGTILETSFGKFQFPEGEKTRTIQNFVSKTLPQNNDKKRKLLGGYDSN